MLLALIVNVCLCQAQYLLTSPNEELRVALQTNRERKGASKFLVPAKRTLRVQVGKVVLTNREIGLTVKTDGHRHSFGKLTISNADKSFRMAESAENRDTLLACMKGRYNGLILKTDEGITLELRAYDNGVAYRFKVSGQTGDYKVLDVCNALPDEKAIAILGTFTGEYVMPWRTMVVEKADNNIMKIGKTHSEAVGRGARIVSWRDALSSISVGTGFNWYGGSGWGDISQDHNVTADFTYKYLYGGLSFTPCHEMQYIVMQDVNKGAFGKEPFMGVMGSVHAWTFGARAGFCLPVQSGYEVWSFIPYVAASVMHLKQHGDTRETYSSVSPHNHYLIGPGIKIQCALRGGITLGAAYERQFFTGSNAPSGMNSLIFTLGKTF